MGKLTTHVLDTAGGKPAQGVVVKAYRLEKGERRKVGVFRTNSEGRTASPVAEGGGFVAGEYELDFAVGDYFGGGAFLSVVTVRFIAADGNAHYHIPLLVSPYGYTTYRGS